MRHKGKPRKSAVIIYFFALINYYCLVGGLLNDNFKEYLQYLTVKGVNTETEY